MLFNLKNNLNYIILLILYIKIENFIIILIIPNKIELIFSEISGDKK